MDMIDPSSTLHIYNINKGHYHGRTCFSVISGLFFFLPETLKIYLGAVKWPTGGKRNGKNTFLY